MEINANHRLRLLFVLLVISCVESIEALRAHKRPSSLKIRPIVGGEKTTISSFPHQVSLGKFDEDEEGVQTLNHFCGGSIIGVDWVLTAAHCVRWKKENEIGVRAGSSVMDKGGEIHYVSRIINHPDYDSSNQNNDISLVQVSPPFVYGTTVKPIKLNKYDILPGSLITVTGWGTTKEDGDPSQTLKKLQMLVVPQWECKWLNENDVFDTQFCASEPGSDTCQGDSGGPVILQGRQVGVVSWGKGCAQPGYPGVYTAVHMFRNWIRANSGV